MTYILALLIISSKLKSEDLKIDKMVFLMDMDGIFYVLCVYVCGQIHCENCLFMFNICMIINTHSNNNNL